MRAAAIVALPLLVALSAGGVAQAAGWQPRDTARAAARVTHDLVGSAALRRMRRQLKRRVRVWVAPLRNRSSQHLPTRALDKTLHKSLAAASQLDLSRGGAPDLLLLPWFFTMADAEGGAGDDILSGGAGDD